VSHVLAGFRLSHRPSWPRLVTIRCQSLSLASTRFRMSHSPSWPRLGTTRCHSLSLASTRFRLRTRLSQNSSPVQSSKSLLVSTAESFFKVKVILWQTVIGPVCLGVTPPSEAQDQILILSDTCGFCDVGRSLWRGDGSDVYSCCWPRQRSYSWVWVTRDSWPYFTLSIRDSPNLGCQAQVFTSPRNKVPQLYPQALGSLFVASCGS
jgi:hypothetical protein